MELGLSIGFGPREPVDRFLSVVRRAEELGVDTCWVLDSQFAMKDVFVALGMLARETTSIKLGTGVTNLVTRHESVVANAINTLASTAPHRILLGLGVGDSAVFSIGKRPMRLGEFGEAVLRLRQLLRGEAAGGLSLSTSSEVPPPIFVSASQPRMLRFAGSLADGVIIMGPADHQIIQHQMSLIDEGAAEVGRDPKSIYRDLWVTLAIGNGSEATDRARSWASGQARWLASWQSLPDTLTMFHDEMIASAEVYDFSEHLQLKAGHAHTVSDDFVKALAVVGDRDECRARLDDLSQTAPDRITISFLSGGREQHLEDIADMWRRIGIGN